MKIGISFSPYGGTYGRYGDEKWQRLHAHGYAAADYNLSHTDTPLYTMDATALQQTLHHERELAQQAEVAIAQVHGPWRWPPQDYEVSDRAERLEKMKRAVIITAGLGCRYLVVHPIMPFGIEDTLVGKEHETWERNLSFFGELADFAQANGVVICVENMPMRHFSLATPQAVLRLVEAVCSDSLRICLDTGHVAVFPDLSVGEEIRRLGTAICAFHIHDNGGAEDSHLYPGDGMIDWTDVGAAIREIGYTGVLSLETAPSGRLDDAAFAEACTDLCRRFRACIGATETLSE